MGKKKSWKLPDLGWSELGLDFLKRSDVIVELLEVVETDDEDRNAGEEKDCDCERLKGKRVWVWESRGEVGILREEIDVEELRKDAINGAGWELQTKVRKEKWVKNKKREALCGW